MLFNHHNSFKLCSLLIFNQQGKFKDLTFRCFLKMLDAKITKMNVERDTDNGFILTFPQIESREPSSDLERSFKERRAEYDLEHGLYFFHRTEETGQAPPSSLQSPQEYNEYHPERLARIAFDEHQGYVLSPQAIGAQLLLNLGEYINQNTKTCATIFNGKIGKKKKLSVALNEGESLRSLDVLYRAMSKWEEGIKEHTNGKIRDLLHPKFSNRNEVVDMVYSGILMGAANSFFEYGFYSLCGIRSIEVEGTKQDWEQLSNLASGLESLRELRGVASFHAWINEVVIKGILGLYEGKENVLFWSSMLKHRSESGDESANAGWLPGINLYIENGKLMPPEWRWKDDEHEETQFSPYCIPVTSVTLISDNTRGIGNIDPTLGLNIGFTGASFKDGRLKPVLGIDAYVSKEESQTK